MTADESLAKLESLFEKIDSSWMFIKTTCEKIIEKYQGKFDKHCKIEISKNEANEFAGEDDNIPLMFATVMKDTCDINVKNMGIGFDKKSMLIFELE
jgi:hypothetical protein